MYVASATTKIDCRGVPENWSQNRKKLQVQPGSHGRGEEEIEEMKQDKGIISA